MSFNSREFEWADISVQFGGVDLTGIRAVKYKKKVERELIYAKGRNPHSIQTGNASFEGEVELLQSDFLALQSAADGDITNINVDILVSYGNPENGDTMKTDKIIGARISEYESASKQGDKLMPVTLAFIARGIKYNV